MFFKKIKIDSLESMTLRITGMRSTEEYEALPTEAGVELSYYTYYCSNADYQRALQGRAIVSTDEFIALLNECNVPRWDGFRGKHPKGVLDGRMFNFKAVVNGDEEIRADGSENFPKGYRELVNKLRDLIRENDICEDGEK